MHIETIKFKSDHLTLIGDLHVPDSDHAPLIIGMHGLFSSRLSEKQIELGQACTQKGMAFFRFDHRGCGQSEGEFKSVTTIHNRLTDLYAAIDMLQKKGMMNQSFGLFGSSLGGCLALCYALQNPIDAVVTLSAPVTMNTIWEVLENSGQAELLSKSFYQECVHINVTDRLNSLHHILIAHGTCDEVVPYANAEIIYQNAQLPKKLIQLKGGGHRLTQPEHQTLFVQETLNWFETYL